MRATTTSAPFARTCIGNGSTSARARVTYAAVRALAGCCGTRVHVSPLPRIREQPAPCPLRRLPLLRSDCLSEQVEQGQQPRLPLLRSDCLSAQVGQRQQPAPCPLRRLPLLRSDCRSSEGSQLNATAAAAAAL